MTWANDSGRPHSVTSALGAWRYAALLCGLVLAVGARPAQAGINVWTSHGPEGGRVGALAVDPKNPTTLYAGTHGGGVFPIGQVSTCVGDRTGDGQVSIDELITMVNIALGTTSIVECGSGDADHDAEITIDEILTAVNVALTGSGGG
jgi:hypothetical protein